MKRAAEHHNVMAQIEDSMKTMSQFASIADFEKYKKSLGKPKPERKAKKQANPKIDKAAILAKRNGWMACDCGCMHNGHDLHHAFIGRMKGYPILDDERNLVLVEHSEHIARKFDNKEWRYHFWLRQVHRFGHPAMMEWVDAVLAAGLDKSRIDWL